MNRKLCHVLALSLLLLSATTVAGQSTKVERDIPYVPNGDPAQTLDLYLPVNSPDKPLPLIVWIHGGGWSAGSKADCMLKDMVGRGYAVASVEYRFSQKAIFPAQIQDCQAAIRWLRANSKKYNIDANQIGTAGASAGGHLAALLGTAGGKKAFAPIGGNLDQSDSVQAVCDYFGPTDFNTVMQQAASDKKIRNAFKFNNGDPYSQLIGGNLGGNKAKGDAVSPVHYVSKDNPPFLIMHGDVDELVPFAQSEELTEALRRAGVNVLLQKFLGANHGHRVFESAPARELVRNFFDKHLKQMDVKVELIPEAAAK
jgi:acetyl esterase/lipase